MLWGVHCSAVGAEAKIRAAEGTESGEVCGGGKYEGEFGGGLEWRWREGCFALAMMGSWESEGIEDGQIYRVHASEFHLITLLNTSLCLFYSVESC